MQKKSYAAGFSRQASLWNVFPDPQTANTKSVFYDIFNFNRQVNQAMKDNECTTSSRFEITKGSLVFPFVLGFGIEGFDSIEIGTFNWGQLSYLEFAVLFAGFIHRLLMADRAGTIEQCFTC